MNIRTEFSEEQWGQDTSVLLAIGAHTHFSFALDAKLKKLLVFLPIAIMFELLLRNSDMEKKIGLQEN